MKILIAAMCLTVCVLPLAGRERGKVAIGTDATAAIFESRPGIYIQYGFSCRWSAWAFCGINVSRLASGPNSDELANAQGHGNMIPSAGDPEDDLMKFGLGAGFWPKKVFDGPFLGCGAVYGQSGGVSAMVEAGWYIRIARIAALSLSVRGEIKYAGVQEKIGYEIFRIGFHFCF